MNCEVDINEAAEVMTDVVISELTNRTKIRLTDEARQLMIAEHINILGLMKERGYMFHRPIREELS